MKNEGLHVEQNKISFGYGQFNELEGLPGNTQEKDKILPESCCHRSFLHCDIESSNIFPWQPRGLKPFKNPEKLIEKDKKSIFLRLEKQRN